MLRAMYTEGSETYIAARDRLASLVVKLVRVKDKCVGTNLSTSMGSQGNAFSLKALALIPSLSCERTMIAPSVCRRGRDDKVASMTSWRSP